MRVELTIRTKTGDHDVVVDAPSSTSVGVVHQRVLTLLGLEPTTVLRLLGRPLDLAKPLADVELRAGTQLTADVAATGRPVSAALALRVIGGPSAGAVVPLTRGRCTIGRDPGNDVVLADDRVSRRHATLQIDAGGATITDHGSTSGTTLNGFGVPRSGATVGDDDVLRLGDSLLTVQSSDLAPAALTKTPETMLLNRPPRPNGPQHGPREIEVLAAPARARPRPVQWGAALVPALAAAALAWFTRTPIFLLFGLMSPVMVLSGAIGDRIHWRGTRRRRATADRRRRSTVRTELADALRDEALARHSSAPDPATLLLIATTPASRVWERRGHDPDLLTVRLGLADLPSAVVVREGTTRRPAGRLRDVPAVVDLRSGPLGVIGPAPVVASLVRWLVAQLAVLHPPGAVGLALLLGPEVAAGWAWARWLPHLGGQVAVGATEGQGLVAELGRRVVQRRSAPGTVAIGAETWTVVVIDHADGLGELPGIGALLSAGPGGGVSAICVAPHRAMLPTACVSVAHFDDDVGARLTLHTRDDHLGGVLVDACSHEWAEQVSRSLAPLTDAAEAGTRALPATCTLSAVLGDGEIDTASVIRWWGADNGRPDTAIGLGADGVVTLDLLQDGPHALIAGTTGAGKSQLLQTLVVGLAVRHPPDVVTFLLIDYKGGAAFAECDRLPHTAGIVTDLDPHLTRRALRALSAELARRERLFATVRAPDLEAYRAAQPREPVARLVIVVDEFATLAAELPEFLHGVVGVARRGRSLGVHLVLATQRPGNAVTPEIRANTSLRIALRVTDVAESTDLIQSADAAMIPRDRPGRAILRSGDRVVAFQTARPVSGATTDLVVERLGEWRRHLATSVGEDGLRHIVDVVCTAAQSSGRHGAPSPWCAPLPDTMSQTELSQPEPGQPESSQPESSQPESSWERREHRVALALLDRPDVQSQPTLALDLLEPAGVLIAGASGSGRTTALLTLASAAAMARPPAALAIHLIDPAGRLRAACEGLPHIGTVVGAGEASLAATLLRRLATRQSHPAPALLLIDGWDRLVAGCDDADAIQLGDLLTTLLRAARESLVTVVVTGDRDLLTPRVAAPFDIRLILRLADRGDYGLVGLGRDDVPSRMPPGRGVRGSDAAEFQIARPGASVEQIRARWSDERPDPERLRLLPLPRRVALSGLPRAGDRLLLGLGGDTGLPISLDPFAGPRRWLVAGPARSGRSTALLTILDEAARVGLRVIVAAPPRSPLAIAATARSMTTIAAHTTGFDRDLVAPTLLLVDDSDAFVDTAIGDQLAAWARTDPGRLSIVLAGRCEDLVTTYRGIAAEVRRSRCGILLRPGPVDGELLGLRLGRRRAGSEPPGRGVIAGDPAWASIDGEPMPIQLAHP